MKRDHRNLPEDEVKRIFESFGLGTKEERDRVLSQGRFSVILEPRPARYVTYLSDNSEGTLLSRSEDAELERSS